MNKILIWDIPTRLFHWAFAGSLATVLSIVYFVDNDSPAFQLHMLFGLAAAFFLFLRIILGVVGSRHARFARFPIRPCAIADYFADVLTGKPRDYAGNNPGSALAALAMAVLVPLLVTTGLSATREDIREIHGALALCLLGAIGAHLLGLALHTFQRRDGIVFAMFTGRKNAPPDEGLQSAHPVWGLVLFAIGAAWVVALFSSHDTAARTVRLPVLGTVVQLGENKSDESRETETPGRKGHDDEQSR